MTLVQGYLIQILEGYTCMISPANLVGLPTKVIWPTALFSKKKTIFIRLLSWPLAGWPVGGHIIAVLNLNIYICVSIKIFIINTRIYLYVPPAVQKFLILHKNVPIFIKTLNLLFLEKTYI